MFKWLIVIAGILFIVFQIFFSSGGTTKFKSDLPKDKVTIKNIWQKKKGLCICFLILCVVTLGLLIAALISFL